ncbi:MAG: hypothetical protein KBB88_03295 [Candidatus Pacebacteria bacterium]|nr:hypothetical protein [Candidatus Paceibacterota bacterium]
MPPLENKEPLNNDTSITPEITGEGVSSNTLKSIRTYASDMAKAIRDKQGSVMKIALAEKERRDAENIAKNPVSKRNISFTLGTIVLVILALGALYFGYKAKRAPKTIEEATQPTVFTLIDGTFVQSTGASKEAIQSSLQDLLHSSGNELDSTTLLVITENNTLPITATAFVQTNGLDFTSQLIRSLSPVFALGIHTLEGNSPFLVFKSDSYDTSYIGMLSSEKTLYDDMAPLFELPQYDISGTLYATAPFVDSVVANTDVRGIKNAAGEFVFFYSITSQGFIIMATSPETYKVVMSAL